MRTTSHFQPLAPTKLTTTGGNCPQDWVSVEVVSTVHPVNPQFGDLPSAEKPSADVSRKDGASRRNLVLLFIDLSASSMIAEQMEAERFADILQLVRHICRVAVERNLGQIVRIQGDGALAVFGYPAPAEDDGRRACDAALEAHEGIAKLQPVRLLAGMHRLSVHSGIHAGLVLVSEGDLERGRLDLVGDAPNTAARLSSLAPTGSILVDAESLGPSLKFFSLEASRLLMLPGRATPVRVAKLSGRSDDHRRFDPLLRLGSAPLLGRAEVIDQAFNTLQAAFEAGRSQIVQVCGEAGIGKTRMLDELDQRLSEQGWCCLRGSCENYLHAEVMLPFAQMSVQLQARVAAAELQAAAVSGNGLSKSFVRMMGMATTLRPLLLVDDWQWADDASRQLLEKLIGEAGPLHIVLASRPLQDGVDGIRDALRLDLSPLTETETGVAVARWAPGTDPFVAAEIHRYAGGVPLLIEELCHNVNTLRTSEFRQLRAHGSRAGSPGWMSSMVATRLLRLSSRQQYLLRVAAVLGIAFARALYVRLAGPFTPGEIEALASADFLFSTDADALRFKHGLTRDAVYDLVPLDERSALHAQVVALLSTEKFIGNEVAGLETLAYHAGAAGLWAQATRHCEAAGDKAMQAFALDRARAQYQAAIEAADRVGDVGREATLRWCSLVHRLGMTCIFDLFALPDVMPLFELCLQRAREVGDPVNTALSAYWLGYLWHGFGRPRQALQHLRESLQLAETGQDRRLAAQVKATLGQALAATSAYDESMQLMDSALLAKRQGVRTGSAVAVGSAYTLACKASIHADLGDFQLAHSALDEARSMVGRSLHPVSNSVCNWAMVILAWQGRWDDAIAVVEESIRIAERTRALLPLAIARAVGGYAHWMRDGSVNHVEDIVQAMHWVELRRGSFYTSIYYGWLVEACVALGRQAQARSYAVRLSQRARAGDHLGQTTGLRALAWQMQLAGDARRAMAYLERADASAQRRGSRRDLALNTLRRAEILVAQGQPKLAIALQQQARPMLLEMGMDWYANSFARVGLPKSDGLSTTMGSPSSSLDRLVGLAGH